MATYAGLRATIDYLFTPALTHAQGVAAERTYRGFAQSLTFPIDAAACGFRVLVNPTIEGFEVTVTAPAVATQPRFSATGMGPTWIAALVECRHQLLERLDRAEERYRRRYLETA